MLLRDKAMLEVLYATGLRVSELVTLQVRDLNLDVGYLDCQGKGGKVRAVPLGNSAKEALEQYLDQARQSFLKGKGSPMIFLTNRGQGMTRQGFWKMLRRYGKLAGIRSSLKPHAVRHSFCNPPVATGSRPSGGADDAGSLRHLHHPDLYPRIEGTPEGDLPGTPSQDLALCFQEVLVFIRVHLRFVVHLRTAWFPPGESRPGRTSLGQPGFLPRWCPRGPR